MLNVAHAAAQQMDDIKNLYRTYKNLNMEGATLEVLDGAESNDAKSTVPLKVTNTLLPSLNLGATHGKTLSSGTLALPVSLIPGSPHSSKFSSHLSSIPKQSVSSPPNMGINKEYINNSLLAETIPEPELVLNIPSSGHQMMKSRLSL